MDSPLLTSNPELKKTLVALEKNISSPVTRLEPLLGSGNQTFLVGNENQTFVLRINGITEHLGVNRAHEKIILDSIHHLDISPSVIIWQPETLVSSYVNHSGSPSPHHLAATLKRLHEAIPLPGLIPSNPWKPTDTIHDYLSLLPTSTLAIEDRLTKLDAYDWYDLPYGICHGDLNPGNILTDEEGKVILIDWEYGRYGPSVYDLAVYIKTHKLDPRAADRFLLNYSGGTVSETTRDGVEHCLFAYEIIEALWLQLAGQTNPS